MSCSKGGKGAHIQPRAISRCQFFTCKLGGCPCSCPSAGAVSLTLFPLQYPWICLCETGLGYGEHRSLLSFEEEIPTIGLKEIHGKISSLGCLNVPLVSILAAPAWHFLNPVLAIEAIILGLSVCQDTEAAHTLNKKIRIKKKHTIRIQLGSIACFGSILLSQLHPRFYLQGKGRDLSPGCDTWEDKSGVTSSASGPQ